MAHPHADSPDQGSDRSGGDPQNLSYQTHRRLIGYLGFLLPVLLYVLAGLRHTDMLTPWHLLDSISAYYYTGSVGVLVGILFALSLFLFTYQGYEDVIADRVVGAVGGFAALGVAFFPTGAPMGTSAPTWWSPTTRVIHYVSAIVLFGSFITFSIWLFRKSNIPAKADLPAGKRRRNAIYLWCGIVMIACMIWAGSSLFTGAAIFWPEAIALWAFALSWLVKGEAHEPIMRGARALLKR